MSGLRDAMSAPLELLIYPTRDGGRPRWQVDVAYEGFCGIGDMDAYLGRVRTRAYARSEAGARRRGERMIRRIEKARRWMAQEPVERVR